MNGVTCDVCIFLMNTLDEKLKGDRSKQAIETVLDTVCDDLPHSLSAGCKSIVDKYTDQIVKFLVEELDAQMVCQKIGLCSSRSSLKITTERQVKIPSHDGKNGITCELCKLLIEKLENKLEGNQSKKAIENALDKLCDDIPWSNECKSLVDTYTDSIIAILELDLKDAEKICEQLKLCTSSLRNPSITSFHKKTDFEMIQQRLAGRDEDELP